MDGLCHSILYFYSPTAMFATQDQRSGEMWPVEACTFWVVSTNQTRWLLQYYKHRSQSHNMCLCTVSSTQTYIYVLVYVYNGHAVSRFPIWTLSSIRLLTDSVSVSSGPFFPSIVPLLSTSLFGLLRIHSYLYCISFRQNLHSIACQRHVTCQSSDDFWASDMRATDRNITKSS